MLLNLLTNVSWLDYLVIVAALLAIYYLFIGVKYYSDELKEVFMLSSPMKKRSFREAGKPDFQSTDDQGTMSARFEDTRDETFEMVERLIATLKIVVQESAEQQIDHASFYERLRKIFEFYGDLKDSQFQFAINELIISECEKFDFYPPSEEELLGLW